MLEPEAVDDEAAGCGVGVGSSAATLGVVSGTGSAEAEWVLA